MGCEKGCKMIARMILKTGEPNSDPHLAYLIYSLEVWPATCCNCSMGSLGLIGLNFHY